LGLDRLAKEKRAAASAERANGEGSRKKPRLDDGDEPFFKGAPHRCGYGTPTYSKQFQVFRLQNLRTSGKEEKKRRPILGVCLKLVVSD